MFIRDQERITYLLEQVMHSQATAGEYQELMDFIAEDPSSDIVTYMTDFFQQHSATAASDFDYSRWQSTLQKVLSADKTAEPANSLAVSPASRLYFLRTSWLRYAVAAMVVLAIGALAYYLDTSKKQPAASRQHPALVQNNVAAPSFNRAVLTLAGGQQVFVDSANIGTLAVQGGVRIQKTADGQIIYNGQVPGDVNALNTLTVPRGSRVAGIVLADGSKVVLNAGSSLTFPVVFSGNRRAVQLSGEAYFEVAKDARKKFIVTSGDITTEVLGTHFNMNTYVDEESVRVTLLEGSVKVSNQSLTVTIAPNAQAVYQRGVLQVNRQVNMDQVMAWKNGSFNFQGADLPAVMRQIARWYDVDVAYEGPLAKRSFSGEISRDINLSDLLDGLSRMNVHFLIEGKKLIVKPQPMEVN